MARLRIGILGVVILALALTCVGYADNSDKGIGTDWDSVVNRYNLIIALHVPDGVTPLHVNTRTDLIEVLDSFQCKSREIIYVNLPAISGLSLTSKSTTIDIVHLHEYYVCNPVWQTKFNLWADIYRACSGSFHWIDSVHNERVGLTDLHPFITLSNTWTDHYIYPNQQSARISGGGILDYYLWIQGLLVYYSEPVSLEVVWSI
jgi:hypothetical protein